MRLSDKLRRQLLAWAMRIIESRKPDVVIGKAGDDYLRRWHIIPRNWFFNIYLHWFVRSDDDRALHDHPWFNISLLLMGVYREHTPQGAFHREEGHVYFRSPWQRHRVELYREGDESLQPAVTLFVTGPKIRAWGFWCPKGWRHWKEFTADEGNRSVIGKGCD